MHFSSIRGIVKKISRDKLQKQWTKILLVVNFRCYERPNQLKLFEKKKREVQKLLQIWNIVYFQTFSNNTDFGWPDQLSSGFHGVTNFK